ncbi:MAG: Rieske 2Fe-2S domain-containing protein [Paracoccaceae bacterium]|nr:Rieske 2Fe-2S domain-containing protein [Paracoccaceae bacterium]
MNRQSLAQVTRPINEASGLPNAHYVSRAVFEDERYALLFRNWTGIGFGKDIPEAGDALPIELVGVPLLAVRQNDGSVSVYQNTCSHRGMILIREKTNVRGTIRCPYHSWCYGLDGRLRSTPHVGGPGHNIHADIRREDLGLTRIPSHVFLDVIFVNLSGTAPPFEQVHRELLDRWSEFDRPAWFGGEDSAFSIEIASNWKLAVENNCESYHLPWVHPGLNSYSRLEDHYHIEIPGSCSGQGSRVYRQIEDADGNRFPDFPFLDAKWSTGSEYISLFPNVLLGVHCDHLFSIVLEPLATGQTREHVALYYASPEALGDSYRSLREANAAQWRSIFLEDVFVVEGMQKGRQGPFFDGGRFSPVMDSPTHLFHEWVATQIQDADVTGRDRVLG